MKTAGAYSKKDDGDDNYELKPYETDVYASIMGLVGDEGYRNTTTAEGTSSKSSNHIFRWRELGRGVAGYTQQVTDCLRNPSEAL